MYLTFGETWTKETRNLLDEGLRCKESIVFFSELFDKLLVLVEPVFLKMMMSKKPNMGGLRVVLFQIVNGHVF